jgi:hypothetical protein
LELSESDPVRKKAIRRVALRPAAFKQLHEKFGVTLPSDGTLRHFLISSGYQSESANQVIKVYKETLTYLERLGASQDEPGLPTISPEPSSPNMARQPGLAGRTSRVITQDVEDTVATASTRLRFRVARDCDADINFFGHVTQEAIDILMRHLELSKFAFPAHGDRLSVDVQEHSSDERRICEDSDEDDEGQDASLDYDDIEDETPDE